MIKKNCLVCKKEFFIKPVYVRKGQGKFCSSNCCWEWMRNKGSTKVICQTCRKEFWGWNSLVKKGFAKFCSKECKDKYQKKENHPNWNGGNVERICLICKNTFLVKPHKTKEGKGIFCSTKCHSKWQTVNEKGENNSAWKGGITPLNHKIRTSIEYRLWRETVFARDDWTCQECDKRGNGELHAHHIKPFAKFPKLRLLVENGQTLCQPCHQTTF